MKLRTLSKTKNLKGVPVLVRVDWNAPKSAVVLGDRAQASLKFTRSVPFLKFLSRKGAVVIALTHFGRPRPRRRDPNLSTKQLVPILKKHGLHVIHHPEAAHKVNLQDARPGSIHLLENVRFEPGEEKNSESLVEIYAELGDIYVNDAFAVCHRKHASVYGLAKAFGKFAFAGPDLIEEVANLRKLGHPQRPFVAVIGGRKLSTKIPIISRLLAKCDSLLVGGAMAVPFLVALKRPVGKSFYEKKTVRAARLLLKNKKLFLPGDFAVVEKISSAMRPTVVRAAEIGRRSIIVDAGPATLAIWGRMLSSAHTILWNGPIGIAEYRQSGFGSRFLARHLGELGQGKTFAVAGGGDTIPVIFGCKAEKGFDFISTGGGAMLEFIANDGKLPGLDPLL